MQFELLIKRTKEKKNYTTITNLPKPPTPASGLSTAPTTILQTFGANCSPKYAISPCFIWGTGNCSIKSTGIRWVSRPLQLCDFIVLLEMGAAGSGVLYPLYLQSLCDLSMMGWQFCSSLDLTLCPDFLHYNSSSCGQICITSFL